MIKSIIKWLSIKQNTPSFIVHKQPGGYMAWKDRKPPKGSDWGIIAGFFTMIICGCIFATVAGIGGAFYYGKSSSQNEIVQIEITEELTAEITEQTRLEVTEETTPELTEQATASVTSVPTLETLTPSAIPTRLVMTVTPSPTITNTPSPTNTATNTALPSPALPSATATATIRQIQATQALQQNRAVEVVRVYHPVAIEGHTATPQIIIVTATITSSPTLTATPSETITPFFIIVTATPSETIAPELTQELTETATPTPSETIAPELTIEVTEDINNASN